MKKTVFLIFIFFVLNGVCLSEDEAHTNLRKAKKDDVLGMWKMTYQAVSPMFMDSSLKFAYYQLFEFREDGTVKNAASKRKMDLDKTDRYFGIIAQGDDYHFPEKGRMIIEHRKHNTDNIRVSIVTKDFIKPLKQHAPLLKKGDIVLFYQDWQGRLFMERYLKRIK